MSPLGRIEWLVYAKRPFAGPEQVLAYLARYTHRIAISNHRLLAIDDDRITFSWRDYRDRARTKPMTLEAHELSRLRTGHGAANMAVVRHFALNLVRQAKDKRAIKRRRKMAAWDHDVSRGNPWRPRSLPGLGALCAARDVPCCPFRRCASTR
jgi:hypothetical protein